MVVGGACHVVESARYVRRGAEMVREANTVWCRLTGHG